MTTEPRHEDYPITPEVKKGFNTDEVFAVVKGINGFEIHEGFAVSIGRRAGESASKGFSTDADKGKTFCPGPGNTEVRTSEDVVKTVLKSTLTNVRHSLNPTMPETKAKKSATYSEHQEQLVAAIIAMVELPDEIDDIVAQQLYAELVTSFNSFMTVNDATIVGQLGNALNGIHHMVDALQTGFAYVTPAAQ